MTSEGANDPKSDSDWLSMDIFVFSNGQQYSPPRKYHLRNADLNWWNSTLNYLARTHYGALQSNIDLYTIEGKKVESPMELSRGACYVAVKPPDKFVDAGYEKYLIRASRSREKRQAQRSGSVAVPDSKDHTEITNPDARAEEPNDELRKENSVLRTIKSSIVIHEASPIEKRKSDLAVQDKPKPLRSATAVKPKERKISSIPRPAVRKYNPPTSPAPNLKPSFRNKDSLRTSNVKITKPEGDRNSSLGTSSHQPNKLVAKSKVYKTTTRPKKTTVRHETVLKKVQESESELKASSAVKIIIDNDNKQSTSSTKLKNIIEDRNLVLVSNLLQNPQSYNNPLVTADPIHIQHNPKTYHAETANLNDLQIDNQEDKKPQININRETKIMTTNNSKEIIEIIELPSVRHSFVNDEHLDRVKGNYMINEVNCEINENNKTNDRLPRKHSVVIMTKKLSDDRHKLHSNTTCVDGNMIAHNEVKIINEAFENNENNTIHNSPPQTHSITIMTDSNQYDHCKNSNKNHKTQDLTSKIHSTATDRFSDDQYVAILNKGDVVNLKLNIEIQNHVGGSPKHNDDTVNLHYVISDIHTEKESQVNIANQVFNQNKSLLSLITKINNHHIGDNHPVFIVQSGACKYCNERNVEMSNNRANKSYLIVLPIENVEMDTKGCTCDAQTPQNRISSTYHSVKATFSCMSLQRLTKPSQMEYTAEASSPISVATTDVKYDEIMNNSTQTEWCDVLLEARLLDDGHYAFRLPTLEMLKYYKLG